MIRTYSFDVVGLVGRVSSDRTDSSIKRSLTTFFFPGDLLRIVSVSADFDDLDFTRAIIAGGDFTGSVTVTVDVPDIVDDRLSMRVVRDGLLKASRFAAVSSGQVVGTFDKVSPLKLGAIFSGAGALFGAALVIGLIVALK